MSDKTHALVLDAESRTIQTKHPLLETILAGVPSGQLLDPQTLREMLALQREWEAGEARKAYTRALVGLKRDLPTVIAKDATVDYSTDKGRTHFKHATLAGVMDAVTEPLTNHGFSLTHTPRTTERGVEVTCRLTHAQGHYEEATLSAPADTSGRKNPAQAIASTITLLSRYTALSLLGIATADMHETPPPPAAPRESIDTAWNMKAAKAIKDRGLSMDDARARCGGRGAAEWTAADLDVLRAWIAATKPVPAPTLLEAANQIVADFASLGATLGDLTRAAGPEVEWTARTIADLREAYARIKGGEDKAAVFDEMHAARAADDDNGREPGKEDDDGTQG